MSKKGKRQTEKAGPEGTDGLTGRFTTDFPLHCQQQGLPHVTLTPLPRSGAPPTGASPTVFVEEDSNNLRSLHVRNLLLDERLLAALTSALEGLQLVAMTLWNVGLREETTAKLLPLVNSCAVRKLVLDGNEVSADHVKSLLQSTCIEQLSLRCCCLGDAFCDVISGALAGNHQLISLDLSCNQITDEGAGHIARALRTNRSLLSLSLSGNRLGDPGVRALCQVLVKFPLTKEEEEKRKSLLATNTTEMALCSSSGRSSSGAGLERSGQGSRGGTRGKKGKEDSGKVSGGGRGGSKGKGKKKVEEKEEPVGPVGGVRGCGQPLLELVVEEEGQLWMRANSTLARLTLSCNRVGSGGVAALLGVLKEQENSALSPVTSDLSSSERSEVNATGLLRVTLEHNHIPGDCLHLEEMTSLIKSRDPLATPPEQTVN